MRTRVVGVLSSLFLILSLASPVSLPANAVTFPDMPRVIPAQAPFLISLWSYDPETYERKDQFCSGVLITNNAFVTAAHCLQDADGFIAITNQGVSGLRGEVLSVNNYVIHPRYSKRTSQNDIAVGLLNFPARIAKDIMTPTDLNHKFTAGDSRIFGWGQDQNGRISGTAMSAKQRDYSAQGKKYFKNFNIKTMIAAGSYNSTEKVFSGACYGDSGGPLISGYPKNPRLIGITSFGSAKGCDIGVPTVYTRVSYYWQFILDSYKDLLNEFAEEDTNYPDPESFSKLPYSETTLLQEQGEYGKFTYAEVQSGGGTGKADISGIMLQNYKSPGTEFGINAYLGTSIDPCVEKQKANFRVQIATDDSQQVDFEFSMSSSSGCFELDETIDYATSVENYPPAAALCTEPSVKFWNSKSEKTLGDVMTFYFDRACIGSSKRIWIRIIRTIDGITDIEPGVDMWAGPFDATPLS